MSLINVMKTDKHCAVNVKKKQRKKASVYIANVSKLQFTSQCPQKHQVKYRNRYKLVINTTLCSKVIVKYRNMLITTITTVNSSLSTA